MKQLRDKFVFNLVYGGITEQEYGEIQEEILEKDRSSLSMASFCLVLMFSGLFLGTFFSEMMATNRSAYCIIGCCFLVIHLLCRVMKKRGKRFVIPLWYVAMTMMVGYAIVLNTVIRNDISATTFCLIMIVAPLLIIDRPWRVFCYFGLITCVFIPIDFHQKSYYLAFTDTVNALCSIFLGSIIHFNIIRTKMREMIQKRYIERQRDTDKLTGCFTKAAFENRMMERVNRSGQQGILFVMDLDHFKGINDNYGHVFGDMVLRTMGESIQQSFPATAMCGRFGGDEFQVWLPGERSQKEITVYLTDLLERISSIKTPDEKVRITASIGCAVCPENGDKYATLFENADAALYTAKNLGRNRYVFCPKLKMKKEA